MANRPKPTALRELEGNPGKRPLPANEPKPEIARPAPPAFLNALARQEWEARVGELADLGLMTRIDVAMFASYCVAWARWSQAEMDLERMALLDNQTHGVLIRTAKGNAVQNPLVGAANTAMLLMQRAATEFGMSPSSRSRLEVNIGEGEQQQPAAAGRTEGGQKPALRSVGGAARYFGT